MKFLASLVLTMIAGGIVYLLTHNALLVGATGVIGGISFARSHRSLDQ